MADTLNADERNHTRVDQAMDACFLTAGQTAEECRSVADECRRRAVICDEFTAEMQSYRRRHNTRNDQRTAWLVAMDDNPHARRPGPEPQRPVPPFPWAKEGSVPFGRRG